MTDKSKNVFHIGDSNTVSNVHVGDVTVNQAPPPELRIGPETVTANPDGTVTTSLPAEVVAPYPVAGLYIEAWAPKIKDFEVRPRRSGMHTFGHTGTRPDFRFTTLQNAFGHYDIVVTTQEAAKVTLKYNFDR